MAKQSKKQLASKAAKSVVSGDKNSIGERIKTNSNGSTRFEISYPDILVSIAFFIWAIFSFSVFITTNKWVTTAVSNPIHLHIPILIAVVLFGWMFIHKRGGTFFSFDLERIRGWELWALFFMFLGAVYYSISSSCVLDGLDIGQMTIHFLWVSLQNIGFLLLYVLSAYVMGSWILSLISVPGTKAEQLLIRIGLGLALNGTFFVILGSIGLLNFWITFMFCLAVILVGFKHSIYLLQSLFVNEIKLKAVPLWAVIPGTVSMLMVLFSMIAFTRGIPVGFDELSQYMSYPKLISGYHSLMQGQGIMNWSVVMSLGYLWTDGEVTLPSLLASFPSILIFCTTFVLARKRLGFAESLLASSIIFTLKTVMWQCSADAKVDLAATFFSLLLLLLVFNDHEKNDESVLKTSWIEKLSQKIQVDNLLPIFIIGGIIAGYAFGVKFTTIFFLIAFVSLNIGRITNSFLAAIGGSLIGFSLLFFTGIYALSGIDITNPEDAIWIGVICGGLGLALLVSKSISKFKVLIQLFPSLLLFVVLVGLMNSVWFYKHYQETKSVKAIDLLRGKPALVPFEEAMLKGKTSSRSMDQKLFLASTSQVGDVRKEDSIRIARLKGSGSYEEVRRYLGYEPGFMKYLSVPLDTVTGKNVSTFPAYTGYFIFLLLPIALFRNNEKMWNIIPRLILLLFLLLGSYISTYVLLNLPIEQVLANFITSLQELNKESMTVGISGFYVSISEFILRIAIGFHFLWKILIIDNPVLIIIQFLMVGGLFILTFWNVSKQIDLPTKLMYAGGFILLYHWIFLSSGISWYGMGVLMVLVVVIFYSLFDEESGLLKLPILRNVVLISIFCLLGLSAVLRLQGLVVSFPSDSKLHAMVLEYGGGKLSSEEVFYDLNFALATATKELNEHPEAGILRIGTYAQYFIDNNDKRVYEDNQLDLFNRLYESSYSPQVCINKLKRAGIDYILFDLNAGSIDNTPGRTLTSKVMKFLNFLNQFRTIKVICTDRLVEVDASDQYRNVQGRNVPVKYDIYGKSVVSPGSMVLLKLP